MKVVCLTGKVTEDFQIGFKEEAVVPLPTQTGPNPSWRNAFNSQKVKNH
jgi:hypothetical protein